VPSTNGTGEDDGWVLVMVNSSESQCSDLCILDAQKISAGDDSIISLGCFRPANTQRESCRLAQPSVPRGSKGLYVIWAPHTLLCA
jgi:Retinal pigment epithelial membrane protein